METGLLMATTGNGHLPARGEGLEGATENSEPPLPKKAPPRAVSGQTVTNGSYFLSLCTLPRLPR